MKIVAVVITLNRAAEASRCLASIFSSSVTPDLAVVVDNGSSVPYLPPADLKERTKVVRLEQNTGPAGGAATGQRQALELGADWVWMVDDDAMAESDTLAQLVQRISVSPPNSYFRSVCYDQSQPDLPFFNSFIYNRHTGILRPVPRERYRDTQFTFDACSMAGLFLPSALLRQAGLFDASLFGWYDDTEFTLRATLKGFQGYGVPGSCLLHPSGSRRQLRVLGRSLAVLADQPARLYYGTRNAIVAQRRFLTRGRFFGLFLPLFAVRRFISIVLLYNNRRAFLHSFARGVLDGMRGKTGELAKGGL